MFVARNLLEALATIIDYALWAYMWAFILRAVLSWVSPDPYNPIVRGLYAVTDPVLSRLRRKLPLFAGSIGRTDLPGGDYSWIMRSILDSLIPLGEEVRVYPGHGPESTIGHEMLYNPFVVEVLNQEVNYKN